MSRRILDGMAIVLSILLAFAIDAEWNELQKRAEEKAAIDDETESMSPGLSIALAHCFRTVYPDLKNPQTEHCDVMLGVFD